MGQREKYIIQYSHFLLQTSTLYLQTPLHGGPVKANEIDTPM